MQDRMRAGNSVAAPPHHPPVGRGGKGAEGNRSKVATTASPVARNVVGTGSPVVVAGSFQAFLADAQAARPGGRHPAADPMTAATAPPPGEILHTLRRGETIWELARERYQVDPAAILRHNNITHPGALRVGQTIRIPTGQAPGSSSDPEEVVASWYGKQHQGRRMANGQRYDMHGATIAHRDMPFGTRVELENPTTGQKAQAVVTDRGPFHPGREVDLSYGLAKRLSLARRGVGTLKMRVL